MSDAGAYYRGYKDALAYDECDSSYWCTDENEVEGYIEGYGDGMDVNLQVEGGVCYQTELQKELLAEVYQ